MKTFKFLPFTLFILLCFAKVQAQEKQQYKAAVIAFYNLENLYDTINDPKINDEEFLPNGLNGWNTEKYTQKLKHMSEAISQIGDEILKGGPTLLGVSEIENQGVLEDLIAMPALKNSGYGIVHFDSPDRRGVDVALLYRKKDFTVIHATSSFLGMPGQPNWRTRDQLTVTGILDGDTISVVVNHWPSRGNGAEYRAEAAKLSRHIADSLYTTSATAKFFIMGDLNDDPVDPSVYKILGAKGKEKQVDAKGLFNPMWQLFKNGIGSLAYRDSWNLFDQIIISKPLLDKKPGSWHLHKTYVFNRPFLLNQDGQYKGYPHRTFVSGAWTNGYSDHLPVYTIIVKGK